MYSTCTEHVDDERGAMGVPLSIQFRRPTLSFSSCLACPSTRHACNMARRESRPSSHEAQRSHSSQYPLVYPVDLATQQRRVYKYAGVSNPNSRPPAVVLSGVAGARSGLRYPLPTRRTAHDMATPDEEEGAEAVAAAVAAMATVTTAPAPPLPKMGDGVDGPVEPTEPYVQGDATQEIRVKLIKADGLIALDDR